MYIIIILHTFCRSELMYAKCMQNIYKMYPTSQQMFVNILYIKFSCHCSFNFMSKMYIKVCPNVEYVLQTISIHFAYTSCIYLV